MTDDQADRPDLLAGLRNGEWLDAQNFPPLEYAIPGLIPEGFTLLIGPPKAGKSWLALDFLLSVSAGGYALGHIKTGAARHVLYLALEDGDRRMQDRCRTLLGDRQQIPALYDYITRIQPNSVLATLDAFLTLHPDTALIIIDTLGKVMPPAAQGESAYQRDYRVGGALKKIADDRPGLALVVLHHDRKATAEDFVDSVSGTHGLAGAADTIVVLARQRQSADGLLKITGRDVVEAEYALKTADGQWTLDGSTLVEASHRAASRAESEHLGDQSVSILDFVRSHGPAGVAAGKVAERFGKDAYQYLKRLADSERLVKLRRGIYADPRTLSEPSDCQDRDGPTPHGSDDSDDSDAVLEAPAGQCQKCGGPCPAGMLRPICDRCRDIEGTRLRAKRLAEGASGSCTQCGGLLVTVGSAVVCEHCRAGMPPGTFDADPDDGWTEETF